MEIYFVIIATILFYLLGIIWRHSEWYNLALKMVFIGMSIFGTIIIIRFYI